MRQPKSWIRRRLSRLPLVLARLAPALAMLPLRAAQLNVPAQFPTIQAAVNAAAAGDEIVVAPGLYFGSGNFDVVLTGAPVEIRSQGGSTTCTLDCQGMGRAFVIPAGATRATRISGFTIKSGSVAGDGGALLIHGSPTITDCLFSGNRAEGNGGAIFAAGDPLVVGCAFNGNNSIGDGGAVFSSGHPEVVRCVLVENTSLGGGSAWAAEGNASFQRCRFVGNMGAGESGGGAALKVSSDARIVSCEFFDNQNFYSDGAAIVAGGTGTTTVVDCVLSGNRGCEGGAITMFGSSKLVCANTTMVGNYGGYGSGVLCFSQGGATFVNCLLYSNHAELGGVVYSQGALTLINSTIVNNSSPMADVGTVHAPAALTIRNCIVWGNRANPNGACAAIQCMQIGGPGVAIDYSCVEGWDGTLGGAGNKGDGPQFIASGIGDFRLGFQSPCIDAGDNNAVPSDAMDIDDDGNLAETVASDLVGRRRRCDDPHVLDTGNGGAPVVDIGAYEMGLCPQGPFIRGDCNNDGDVSTPLSDAVFLILYAFGGGRTPDCVAACDANADGNVAGDVTDIVFLLEHGFLGGAAPPLPFPDCGDGAPVDDLLRCEASSCPR